MEQMQDMTSQQADINTTLSTQRMSAPQKKAKKKFKKKIVIIPAVIVVTIGAVIFMASSAAQKQMEAQKLSVLSAFAPLEKQELEKTVNITGLVESDNSKNVYSKLSYPVSEVLVEVGDIVTAGQKLCVLDTESVQFEIDQQRASISSTRTTSSIDYDSKRKSYETTKSLFDQGLNAEMVGAQSAYDSAFRDLDDKQRAYDNNFALYELGDISEVDLSQHDTNLKNAISNLEKARVSLESTTKKVELDLKNAESAMRVSAATGNTQSQEIGVKKLDAQLGDAVITSPIDGTITVVNATVGNTGNGLLFVVEDMQKLIVKAKVKEYDAPLVKPELAATIKSDGTGETSFPGKVKQMAPTAVKAVAGQSASNVEFETKISVDNISDGLKIGMNARVSLMLDKKSDIWAVPLDSVLLREDGKTNYIKVLVERETLPQTDPSAKAPQVKEKKAKENKSYYVVEEVNVVLGLQTDFQTQIISLELKPGMKVLKNPSEVVTGTWAEKEKLDAFDPKTYKPVGMAMPPA